MLLFSISSGALNHVLLVLITLGTLLVKCIQHQFVGNIEHPDNVSFFWVFCIGWPFLAGS